MYEEDVKSPGKLTELLRGVMKRLSDIESALPPEATEFEVNAGTDGAEVRLLHGFNGPVRWYVTTWTQTGGSTYPVDAPVFVQDATSDSNTLVLRSYSSGKAVIRVEQSNGVLDLGVSTAPNPGFYAAVLDADFTTINTGITDTGLSVPVKAGETWVFQFNGTAGCSSASGMKFGIGGGGSDVVVGNHYSSTTSITTRGYQVQTAINTLGNTVHNVAGGQRDDQFFYTVQVASDGFVYLGVAAVAGTATVYANSSLIGWRVKRV